MIGPVLTVPGECNGRWKHTFVGMARATQQARIDDVTQSKYSPSGQPQPVQDLVYFFSFHFHLCFCCVLFCLILKERDRPAAVSQGGTNVTQNYHIVIKLKKQKNKNKKKSHHSALLFFCALVI